MPRVQLPRQVHRTVGAHVSEETWRRVMYQATLDAISASEYVRRAVEEDLARRGVPMSITSVLDAQEELPLTRRIMLGSKGVE